MNILHQIKKLLDALLRIARFAELVAMKLNTNCASLFRVFFGSLRWLWLSSSVQVQESKKTHSVDLLRLELYIVIVVKKKKKTFITRTVMIKSFNLFWFCIELELTLTTSCVNGKVICLSTVSQNWIENLVNAAHYSYELLNFRFVLCDVSSLIEFPVYIINSRPMMRWWQIWRLIVLLGIDLRKTLLLSFFFFSLVMNSFLVHFGLMFMIHDIFCYSVEKTKSLKRITNSVPDGCWNYAKSETSVEKIYQLWCLKV